MPKKTRSRKKTPFMKIMQMNTGPSILFRKDMAATTMVDMIRIKQTIKSKKINLKNKIKKIKLKNINMK
jgi:hypothetical protein